MDYSKKNGLPIKDKHEGQFQYLERWVNKEYFRAFVYDDKGVEKLANSYAEFESLTGSGIWFASKPNAPIKGKLKDVVRANS